MSKNTLNILVVSASSLSLARKIRDEYPGKTVIYCREADNDIEPVTSFKELTGNLFDKSETIVFIGAMGICVRSIAPYIKSKYTDPAVICLDSTGKYVVSVLSGHIGGANELTHELARILDAEAVVTTQSDNQGLWALDTFAKQYGWEQDVYNPQEGIISFFQTDFEKIDEETFDEVAGDADTLAGLLLELKGEFPALHEKVTYGRYEFEVLEMDNRRILKVKFTVNAPAEPNSSSL